MNEFAYRLSDLLPLLAGLAGVLLYFGAIFGGVFRVVRRVFLWLFGARLAAARQRRGESWVPSLLRPILDEGPLSSGFIPSLAYLALWMMIFVTSFRFLAP